MKKGFQIAIDGPLAAGKGTVAKLVAERLGWTYVDTGAMYRVAVLLAKRKELAFSDGKGMAVLVKKAKIEIRYPQPHEKDGRLSTVLVDGEDVSWKIRTEEIGIGSSMVATQKQVRKELVKKQQEIASKQNVVMEGRDITYRVLPDADLKIFLTADEKVRARRRKEQLLERGKKLSFEQVLKDLKKRDKRDMTRKADPLKVVPEAWVLDTTELTIEQVVGKIVERVRDLERVD